MALLGRGALANWHDVPDGGHDEFRAWHSHEHIPERVGVPGFLRGRRGRALNGGRPQYFILYETETPEVLASPGYLARLNDPTPWSRAVLKDIPLTIRAAARVEASFGRGVGGFVLAARFARAPKPELGDALAAASARRGVLGAHLLRGDDATTQVPTKEKTVRAQPDETAAWIALIEGVDKAAVEAAWAGCGAAEAEWATYALEMALARSELA
jgi:hypothetical protein